MPIRGARVKYVWKCSTNIEYQKLPNNNYWVPKKIPNSKSSTPQITEFTMFIWNARIQNQNLKYEFKIRVQNWRVVITHKILHTKKYWIQHVHSKRIVYAQSLNFELRISAYGVRFEWTCWIQCFFGIRYFLRTQYVLILDSEFEREVGGWGRVPFSRNLMKPTPRRKWYLTTGRRFH